MIITGKCDQRNGCHCASDTLAKQIKHFQSHKLNKMRIGTINMVVNRVIVLLPVESDMERSIEWHPGIKEDFCFIPCELTHNSITYSGYIYGASQSPHILEKKLELIMSDVANLTHDDDLTINVPDERVMLLDEQQNVFGVISLNECNRRLQECLNSHR